MIKILHLSDIHLGKHEGVPNFLLQESPAIAVITGDLSNDGTIPQLKEAKQFIDTLNKNRIKTFIVPGNHDFSMNGLTFNANSLDNFKNIFGIKEFPTLNKVENVYFIGLNTLEGKILNKDYYGIDGEIGPKQLERLDKLISHIRQTDVNAIIVVYMHHTISERNPLRLLIDKYYLFKIIRNRIDVLMFGHSHVLKNHSTLANQLGIKVISEAPSTNKFYSIENHIIFSKNFINELKKFYIIPEIIIDDKKIEYKVKKYRK